MNATISTPSKARTFAQWKNGLVQIWGIDEAHGYCRVVLLSQRKSETHRSGINWPEAANHSMLTAGNAANH